MRYTLRSAASGSRKYGRTRVRFSWPLPGSYTSSTTRPSAQPRATAEKLRSLKLEVAVKAGEKSRLFGSVTNREIAELIAREGIEVDRHLIHLREPIKTLGDHRVEVRLMAGVEAQLTVTVVPA